MAYLVSKSESIISTFTAASIATQQGVVDRLDDNTLLLGNPPCVSEKMYARVSELAQTIDSQESRIRAIYVGRVDRSRGLDEMVDAMEIANRTACVRLWLIGPADNDDLESARSRPGWKYVDYIPKMPQEQAFAYIERAHVGLIVMRDVGGHAAIDSNKLYEYMMFGKPFIASAFDTWIDKLAGIDAGWYVRPGSADEVARILLEIADNRDVAMIKGTRGKNFTQSYNWEAESQNLLNLYAGLQSRQ
jgi:glycosyltransferase involved in cell wall biosynthesis